MNDEYRRAIEDVIKVVEEHENRPLCMCFSGCPDCTDQPTLVEKIRALVPAAT